MPSEAGRRVPDVQPPSGGQAGRWIAAAIASRAGEDSESVMFTGLAPRAGTSLVAFEYWASRTDMADEEVRVLLDYNLGTPDPRIGALSGGLPGITDYLAEPAVSIQDICLRVARRHYVLPAGRTAGDPNEYVLSPRFETLFAELHNHIPDARLVVDAPPLTFGDLTYALSELCDSVFAIVPGRSLTVAEINRLPRVQIANMRDVIRNRYPGR